ncbi:MAG: hypothetical protein ACE5KY_05840 [Candidatus Tectimicrobiota bacterium]
MMRGKRLVTAFAAVLVVAALLVGPIPGLTTVPPAQAAKGDSYLTVVEFNDSQLETLFWLVPIGLVQPFMFWFDMYNDAY